MRYAISLLILSLSTAFAVERIPPTQRVYQSLDFVDDLDLVNLNKAIDRQLKSFTNLDTKFKLGTLNYKRADLKDSLILFKKHINTTIECLKTSERTNCYNDLSLKLNDEFRIYKPLPKPTEAGYATGQTLFTSYYSPDFEGSKTKTDIYKNPIYAKPATDELRKLSRNEIDFQNKLEGQGLELFYVKESLFDIWLLHVEGGGRVKIVDKDGNDKPYYLSYDSTNKQKFKMLYKYMRDNAMLTSGNYSIAHQRDYISSHPEHEEEILSSCPSYVYFKVTEDEPLGTRNVPLTENRSLATDYRLYKEYGLINFIQTDMPTSLNEDGEVQSKAFSRFMLNQDTGGAIKGRARSDLYFGYGKNAEFVANHLHTLGNQFFLIKKP